MEVTASTGRVKRRQANKHNKERAAYTLDKIKNMLYKCEVTTKTSLYVV